MPLSVILVPLDGSAPTSSTDCPGQAALAHGDTVLWAGYCPGPQRVYSLRAGVPSPRHAAVDVQDPLVTGVDRAVAATPGQYSAEPGQAERAISSVIGFTVAPAHAPVIAAAPSPVSAAAFALTPGRIVYADDAPVPGRPAALARVMSRPWRTTSTRVVAGSPTLVATGSGTEQIVPDLVGAPATVTVYADHFDRHQNATLHVVSPYGHATITQTLGYGSVRVSGDRVLFQRIVGNNTHVDVYDVSTGRTRLMRTIKNTTDPSSTVICGDYLAWATRNGGIYREDLRSGAMVRLRRVGSTYPGFISVYMYGDWVGWHTQEYATPQPGDVDEMRNAKTLSATVDLRDTLWSLTSAGAITDTAATLVPEPGDGPPVDATAFRLHSYRGRITTLLSTRHVVEGPQLVGHTLAWVDAAGVLRVTRVRVGGAVSGTTRVVR